MTIPSTPRKAGPFLGNGATTSFPFAFKVFGPADIKVVIANSAGVEITLALNSDYSVTLNPNQDTSPGGVVTYPISGSPLPPGSALSIIGNISYDQPLDLPSGGNFSPLALENQLDRATMQIQQLREEMDRAVKLPPTRPESVEELVGNLQRIADSADNLDTVAGSIGNVNTVAGAIGNVNTVVANVANVNAVATNATNINTVANNITGVNAVVADISKVNTVAGVIGNVNTVAGAIGNVNTVATNVANVNAVATNATNINTVANNITGVNAVVADISKVNTVAGVIGNVNTVAGAIGNVNTVATNVANVNAVGANISKVNTVAGVIGNVNTVAGAIGNVNTVATNVANVNAVATNATNINTVAANITDVTNYADTYLGPKASPPTTRNDGTALQAGDLYFNTASGALAVYHGSGWTELTVTATWGPPRTITIGNTGKSVDGSTNVSWSLAEIGAAGAGALPGGTDLNTVVSAGFYRIASTFANAPSDVQYGQLIVARGGYDTVFQIATGYNNGEIYWRQGNPPAAGGNGSWGPWRRIWHEGNATALVGANGWAVLPGGAVLQWGRLNIVNPPNDYFGTAYFPVAFPNNIFQVNTTLYSYNGAAFDTVVAVTAHRLSSFDFTVQEWSNVNQNVDVTYIAIGA
jgi:hypothetical protein